MSDSKIEILRRVRVFADLNDEDVAAVLAVLKARRGAPGDTLFRQGERGDSLMIVLEGQLTARVRTESGKEEEVARLGPGEIVGEMAFIDAEPRSATISAPNGATVLDFTRDALAILRRGHPRVAAAILRNLLGDVARRLREVGGKLSDGAAPRSTRGAGPESMRRAGRGLTAEQLRGVPALAGYAAEDLELLAYIATLRAFAPGEVLMEEGSAGDACWLIVGGSVAVTRGENTAPLSTLGPGALVGQLALIDRAPRSATVRATQATQALEVRADAFANLLRAHSPVALRFQEQVARAGVRQLRVATRTYAEAAARAALSAPSSMQMLDLDDWDEGDGPKIELDTSYRR